MARVNSLENVPENVSVEGFTGATCCVADADLLIDDRPEQVYITPAHRVEWQFASPHTHEGNEN
jgi:hypothetical protein